MIAAKQFWCICPSIPQSLYIQACTGQQLRVVLKIMSSWFSFYFRVCFCKLKKEHSGLCDWWDLTKWHRKGRKAAETEDTRKGKNLNSEFLEHSLTLSAIPLFLRNGMAFFMQCGAMTNAMHCIGHRNALQRATESTAFLGAVAPMSCLTQYITERNCEKKVK